MSFERVWHKSYPHGVPGEIDVEKITLPEVLSRSARRFPDVTALIYMGRKIGYPALDGLVNSFARALLDLGIQRGDTVAMLLPNIPQVVIANYATFRIGAVAAQNNPLYTERELTYQLNDSDAEGPRHAGPAGCPGCSRSRPQTKIENIVTCHINDYLPVPQKAALPFRQERRCTGRCTPRRICRSSWISWTNATTQPRSRTPPVGRGRGPSSTPAAPPG